MLNRKSNILNRYGMVFVAMRHEVGIEKTPLSGRVLTQGRIKSLFKFCLNNFKVGTIIEIFFNAC